MPKCVGCGKNFQPIRAGQEICTTCWRELLRQFVGVRRREEEIQVDLFRLRVAEPIRSDCPIRDVFARLAFDFLLKGDALRALLLAEFWLVHAFAECSDCFDFKPDACPMLHALETGAVEEE